MHVTQSPLPPLPPGFWLVPPNVLSPGDMKIEAVCPHHLWDANTCIMQPISISRFTEKIGALLLCFKQKEFFIIFGLVATHESLNPWCRMAPRRSLQTLDEFFNSFEFDFRSAMRSRKSRNPTLEYASDIYGYDGICRTSCHYTEAQSLRKRDVSNQVTAPGRYLGLNSLTSGFHSRITPE